MPLEGKFGKWIKTDILTISSKAQKETTGLKFQFSYFSQEFMVLAIPFLSQLSVYNPTIQLQLNCFIENYLSIEDLLKLEDYTTLIHKTVSVMLIYRIITRGVSLSSFFT